MHYGWNAFAIDPSRSTITNKDGSKVEPNGNGFTPVIITQCLQN